MTASAPILVLFRRDLRLAANPALNAAARTDAPVIPVFVYDPEEAFAPGRAARQWLSASLEALARDLRGLGSQLILRRGDPLTFVPALARETGARAVHWNRRYAPAHVERDKAMEDVLRARGIAAASFSASLIREPWETFTRAGAPFQVFTPFWRRLLETGPSRDIKPRPARLRAPDAFPPSENAASWDLVPLDPMLRTDLSAWRPGEAGAQTALDAFLADRADGYAASRDFPARASTSRLSPHLAFGELDPVEVWRAILSRIECGAVNTQAGRKFLSELAWREFAWSALHYNPALASRHLRAVFGGFPWRNDPPAFETWKAGMTGYPIVDAGMRELRRTGWIHNRVRMIVASFLTKDLLIDWREGAAWFAETLLDADPANNAVAWQWVAGSGIDAAPFFRIFNPVTQGETFDPEGDYVRGVLPELGRLSARYIHQPWTAPAPLLREAGVEAGRTYPRRVVDHDVARKRALLAYRELAPQALVKGSHGP